jgi:succinate dehydrogenase flavin-adding protein (antitoxin of CptAB toxin-antitoxin module)
MGEAALESFEGSRNASRQRMRDHDYPRGMREIDTVMKNAALQKK